MREYRVKKKGVNQGRIFYTCPDHEVSYFFVMFCYGLQPFFVMILIKVLDLLLQFQWDGTRSYDGWYQEEKYVEHVQKSLAKKTEAVDESAPMYDEAVNQQKNDLSVLGGIGREILILLKCIVGLVCLVLFEIVYIVSRL